MAEHQTSYATSTDGVSIAYQVGGSGPHNLVWVPGFASHVELFWDLPGFSHAYQRIERFCRLALFDKRGTGLSDRSLGMGSLETRMQDVRAVMEAAGFESATVLAISEGGAMSTLFAATYPERVDSLILIGADVTGGWIQPDMIPRVEREWGSGTLMQQLWLNGAGDLDQLSRIERAMGTPRAMAELLRHNLELDARSVLDSIHVPTLVLHCTDDPVVPIASGRYLAEHIPNAKLVEIDAAFHGSNLPEEMDRYVDEVEEFITGRRLGAANVAHRVLATILITDIVGSTERAADLGDDRWTTLLAEHDRTARQAVARFEGRWIKSTGDGILAVFDGPARAIAAARAIQDAVRGRGLQIRAGIHTGEIEEAPGDVHGIAVHIAARIASSAADDEIWVSSTVPGLVVGSGLEFDPRGEFTLKGVPGTWGLAAVR
jgi:pimeloyl-ACP methyl ester carboxylesterase